MLTFFILCHFKMHSSGSTRETGQIECRNLPYKRNLCRLAPCYMYFVFKAVKFYILLWSWILIADNHSQHQKLGRED